MIQLASMMPTSPKILENNSNNNSLENNASASFMDLFNELMQENEQQGEQENDLMFLVNLLIEKTIDQSNTPVKLVGSEPSDENKQEAADKVSTLMSSILEAVDDPNGLVNKRLVEKLKQLLESNNTIENTTVEKFAKLFSEEVSKSGKQDFQTIQSYRKSVKEQIENIRSGNNKAIFSPMIEQKLDMNKDGKEVVFQSLNRVNQNIFTGSNPNHDNNQTAKVPAENFAAEVMKLIENKAQLTKANDLIQARFSLTPEQLGDIDVKITIHKGQVLAQFIADTAIGKDALESQVSLLRTSLQQQGFQVDKIEISQNSQMLQHSFSQQEERSRQEQSQQRFSKKKNNQEEFYQSHAVIDDLKNKGVESTLNLLA
ncbi:flagellar hook-length control protein FliK [Neobacillus sp. LXY-4]|uniref:flagellar hook-length control protein FliK n=1 Tax=Neobacillus sp. LXY-4 TaxID=3379826 RepID=UPI003EE37190